MKYLSFLICFVFISDSSSAQKISKHTIHFNTASSVISDDEKGKLNQFIKTIDSTNEIFISINSYCDDRGSIEYNKNLSVQRVQSVRDFLLQNNIESVEVADLKSNGELQLDSTTKDIDQQRKNNRRADLVFSIKVIDKPKEIAIEKDVAPMKELFSDSMKVGDKFTLENILFEGGRTALLDESFPALDKLVIELKKNPQYEFCILGHVCCVYNHMDGIDHDTGKRNLSEARAKTIYSYLISKGIPETNLTYKGMKGDFPTGRGEKYDRRVELEITGISSTYLLLKQGW